MASKSPSQIKVDDDDDESDGNYNKKRTVSIRVAPHGETPTPSDPAAFHVQPF
jgi:hypothetical protein